MKKYRIDEDGFFIEPVITDEEAPELIEIGWEDRLYKPRWDGQKWIEGATQEYIDEQDGIGQAQPPTPADRIAQLEEENALLALELIDTQIRLEQSEHEQAALILALVEKGVI